MRIFVAYGYNDRDRWIEAVVFPLISAFDSKIVHGKDLQGEILSEEIKKRIKSSEALIAFATRRDELKDGRWTTHRWVTDELAFASQIGKTVVEVREVGVEPQGGIAGDRARIDYDEEHRFETMVQLTGTLVRWHQQFRRVHVIPLKQEMRGGVVVEVGPDWLKSQLNQRGFQCRYRVLEGRAPDEFRGVELHAIEGRVYFYASGLAVGARLQLEIVAEGHVYRSDFESIDAINLTMPLVDSAIPPRYRSELAP
jgi:hypothetical protein